MDHETCSSRGALESDAGEDAGSLGGRETWDDGDQDAAPSVEELTLDELKLALAALKIKRYRHFLTIIRNVL
jgi:hypothetical protein